MVKKPKKFTPIPLPLGAIRTLFCMDIPKLYQPDFTFEAPFTPHEMVTTMLRDNGLPVMADELDAAEKTPDKSDYSIGCISTTNGSCFAYARYKQPNGIHQLAFASAVFEQELSTGSEPVFDMKQQTLLAGIETDEQGQASFTSVGDFCRLFFDEDEDSIMINASDMGDFYAALCYMQQSMASCACGQEIDLFRNQCWLDPIVVERAYEELLKLLAVRTRDDITRSYNAYATMAEELLDQIKAEGDGGALGYPQKKLYLN